MKDLEKIVNNLFWAWNADCVDLFKRIDNSLWESCGHNPVKLIGSVSQARLEELAKNEGFIYQLKSAVEKLDKVINAPSWYDQLCSKENKPLIAYFSAEFGIHEALPIYSGGLGILAGDHLKSASDLGLPLVGVGLMYQNGYFRQYLNADGWQQERYVENDFYNIPIELVRKKSKRPLTISVQFPQRNVHAQIWKATVGRVDLYLLDTNIPANRPEDREITSALYGGDNEMRIRQEIILGIGGFKGLLAMGLEPTVCHMNEGHAAFLGLERIRELRNDKGLSFEEAAEATRAGNVFTVHTPVAAGCDEFSPDLMDKYFGHYFPKLGLNRQQFMALGRFDSNDDHEPFKMPVLAIKLSSYRNGVSELHGEVSRDMWQNLWPNISVDEVPIDSVTNGIHSKTWVSGELNSLYELYLGSNWAEDVFNKTIWEHVDQIPDEELWRIHQRCKEKLIGFARRRLKRQLERRGASNTELIRAEEVLDPEALTIGFARRFATYKRGNLLLSNPERLRRLLDDVDRPIQFIFAGKAHPRDEAGKELIKEIVHFAGKEEARRRILFIEDYDMDVARYLVQGVDVWLNNPRRPLEASGTSGMKAAANGVLNLSTFDGWWCEGYGPDRGWVIGAGETYEDTVYGDKVECEALYNILENEVVPLFYSRSNDKLPRGWIRWMKNCIRYCAPEFNTHRMVADYARKFYNPAATRFEYLKGSDLERSKKLTAWGSNLRKYWSDIRIKDVDLDVADSDDAYKMGAMEPQLKVGGELCIKAEVQLGKVEPDHVAVEIYYGNVDSKGNVKDGSTAEMKMVEKSDENGTYLFAGYVPCRVSGQHGFSVRVIPKHEDLVNPLDMCLVHWKNHLK